MKYLTQKTLMVIIVLLMIFSFIFVFFSNSKNEVENYKLSDNLVYTGFLEYGVFSGEGKLKTEDGTYIGNFKDGRFSGEGEFKSKEGWTYKADFIPKNVSKNIIIINEGTSYKKEGKKWKK